MKNNIINKMAAYTALILISALPYSLESYAETEKKTESTTKSTGLAKPSLSTKQKILAEKSQQIVEEARESIAATQQALLALDNKEVTKATTLLKSVTKTLDDILIKNPQLALITADVSVAVFEFIGDESQLKNQIKQADDLLDSGMLQEARQILDNLSSELKITTISIPLSTYPNAIKQAVADIDLGKTDAAAQILDDILSTLVEVTEIIPIPILKAESLLTEASIVEHKEDMAKDITQIEVLKLTDAAKQQLKIAELLGYGGKPDYQLLYSAINDIKEAVHTSKSKATWEKIKLSLADLKNKISQPK
ncbi:MAG: YfdX family protein [Methylococcaceae bacterium]|jgi:hypothetical protein